MAAAVPAGAPAAGLVAAFARYVSGQGFELGLVNASTGTRLTLPPGVNTTDDELHPSLSIDGRDLTWMRTRLLPMLNGDIPVPSGRTLFMLDRQTGVITTMAPTPRRRRRGRSSRAGAACRSRSPARSTSRSSPARRPAFRACRPRSPRRS